MIEQVLNIERMEDALALFGKLDENIALIERELGVRIVARGTEIKVSAPSESAEAVTKAVKVLEGLLTLLRKGETIGEQNIRYLMTLVDEGKEDRVAALVADCVCITARGKPIKAKTLGQKNYIEQIKENTIVLAVGPAGTGKTYLAVAMAVQALRDGTVNKIILTRPAVEAGERLGNTRSSVQQKIDPYLRPLYDALFEMLGPEVYARHLERGTIEVAPLAYMRGRTLDDAFIILDEAQNTTPEQMKMFLTRLGFGSKAVVTGDITQIDLPDERKSGAWWRRSGSSAASRISRSSTLPNGTSSGTAWCSGSSRHTKNTMKKGNGKDNMSTIKVQIVNKQRTIKIPSGTRLLIRRCCHAVVETEGITSPCEVSVSFVDNDQIRELNREYRHKDMATDVLSFPLGENGVYDKNPPDGCRHAGRYCHLDGEGDRAGGGVRPFARAGGRLSDRPRDAASAGLRPRGRRHRAGPDARAGGDRPCQAGPCRGTRAM